MSDEVAARRAPPHRVGAAMFFALAALTTEAWADKVAVLPYSSANSVTTREDAERARTSTRAAVAARGFTLPTDSEMLTAEMAVKDGVPDASDEYLAAAKASSSDWTLSARVEALPREEGARAPEAGPYRLELFAFHVPTGRVESLARTIDDARAETQIAEMLALMLRPEGIGDAEIRWTDAKPPLPTAPLVEPTPLAPVVSPPPRQRHTYAEGHPFAVGANIGVWTALSRPDNARGSSTSLMVGGAVAYAIEDVPGLEVRADAAGAAAGPRSFLVEGGARYAIMALPASRVYLGPELGVGAFFTLGADTGARFLARGSAFAGVGIGARAQLEIVGDVAAAPGGAGTLVLGGGGVRGVFRF